MLSRGVLPALLLLASVASGDHEQPHSGSTVCIEIRPASSQSPPTRVCGPLAHGGIQRSGQQQDLSQQQPMPEMKAAEPPRPPVCSHGGVARYNGPPPMPMMMTQRMMEPMPMAPPPPPLWRESSPYDVQRSHMGPMMFQSPMGMPMGGPMGGPMLAPPPMPVSRSWFSPSAAPEESKPKSAEGMDQKEVKEYENLLLECEQKTKLLMEKEKEISRLKEMIEPKKKPAEQSQQKQSPQQTTKNQ